MNIDEIEVYVTSDGLGRAAIVRETEGRYCIYVHWIWSPEAVAASGLKILGSRTDWFNDTTPLDQLYEDRLPEVGPHWSIDEMRARLRNLPGF